MNSKYWNNICKLQEKQTIKGVKKYGKILEDNVNITPVGRLIMIEEELIDALMYIEHLKEVMKNDK